MIKDQKRKKASKKLSNKKAGNNRSGQMCMIARHPAMQKDIGKPLLREEEIR